jgi:hypothetical protein
MTSISYDCRQEGTSVTRLLVGSDGKAMFLNNDLQDIELGMETDCQNAQSELFTLTSTWFEHSPSEKESILENYVDLLKPLTANKPYDKTLFCQNANAEIIAKLDFLQEIPDPQTNFTIRMFLLDKVTADDDVEAFKIHYALRLTVSSSIVYLLSHFVARGCLKILTFLSSQKYKLCMYSVRIASLSPVTYFDSLLNIFDVEEKFIIAAIHTTAVYGYTNSFNYLFEKYTNLVAKTFPKKFNLALISEPTIKHKIYYKLLGSPHLAGVYPATPTTKVSASDQLYTMKFTFVL